MSKIQTIFRNASPNAGGYTTISNKLLQCKGLAPEVRGFVATLLSQPDDWVFHASWAETEFGIGETKLKRIIRESKKAGFMKAEKLKNGTGKFSGCTIYYFTDVPGVFCQVADTVSGETAPADATVSGKNRKWQNPTGGKTTPHTKEPSSSQRTESEKGANPADSPHSPQPGKAEETAPPSAEEKAVGAEPSNSSPGEAAGAEKACGAGNSKTVRGRSAKPARAPLDENWRPTARTMQWATTDLNADGTLKIGATEAQVEAELEKFLTYYLFGPGQNKPWSDWNRCFQNWMRNVDLSRSAAPRRPVKPSQGNGLHNAYFDEEVSA